MAASQVVEALSLERILIWTGLLPVCYLLVSHWSQTVAEKRAWRTLFLIMWLWAISVSLPWRVIGMDAGLAWAVKLALGSTTVFADTLTVLSWVTYFGLILGLTRLLFNPIQEFRDYPENEVPWVGSALIGTLAFLVVIAFCDYHRVRGYNFPHILGIIVVLVAGFAFVCAAVGGLIVLLDALFKAPPRFWEVAGNVVLVLAGAVLLLWVLDELSKIPAWVYGAALLIVIIVGLVFLAITLEPDTGIQLTATLTEALLKALCYLVFVGLALAAFAMVWQRFWIMVNREMANKLM
jgi:hypothetical protein